MKIIRLTYIGFLITYIILHKPTSLWYEIFGATTTVYICSELINKYENILQAIIIIVLGILNMTNIMNYWQEDTLKWSQDSKTTGQIAILTLSIILIITILKIFKKILIKNNIQ